MNGWNHYLCDIFCINLRHRRRGGLFGGGFFLRGGHVKLLQRRLSKKTKNDTEWMETAIAARDQESLTNAEFCSFLKIKGHCNYTNQLG